MAVFYPASPKQKTLFKLRTEDINPKTLLEEVDIPKLCRRLTTLEYKMREVLFKKESHKITNPNTALHYVCEKVGRAFPPLEHLIAQDGFSSYMYAKYVLKAPFPKGEKAISKDILSTVLYANNVLNGRFIRGEKLVVEFFSSACWYAYNPTCRTDEIMKAVCRRPENAIRLLKSVDNLEAHHVQMIRDTVAKHPKTALQFAFHYKVRMREAEDMIARYPQTAYLYARDVLKGPFPKAERFMAKNRNISLLYASQVTLMPFPEAEPLFLEDSMTAARYASFVLGMPWAEGEAIIKEDPKAALLYIRSVLGQPWEEAEEIIATCPLCSMEYALYIVRGRFIAGEPHILKSTEDAQRYLKLVYQERNRIPLELQFKILQRNDNEENGAGGHWKAALNYFPVDERLAANG